MTQQTTKLTPDQHEALTLIVEADKGGSLARSAEKTHKQVTNMGVTYHIADETIAELVELGYASIFKSFWVKSTPAGRKEIVAPATLEPTPPAPTKAKAPKPRKVYTVKVNHANSDAIAIEYAGITSLDEAIKVAQNEMQTACELGFACEGNIRRDRAYLLSNRATNECFRIWIEENTPAPVVTDAARPQPAPIVPVLSPEQPTPAKEIYQCDAYNRDPVSVAEEFARTYFDEPRRIEKQQFGEDRVLTFSLVDGYATYTVHYREGVKLVSPSVYVIARHLAPEVVTATPASTVSPALATSERVIAVPMELPTQFRVIGNVTYRLTHHGAIMSIETLNPLCGAYEHEGNYASPVQVDNFLSRKRREWHIEHADPITVKPAATIAPCALTVEWQSIRLLPAPTVKLEAPARPADIKETYHGHDMTAHAYRAGEAYQWTINVYAVGMSARLLMQNRFNSSDIALAFGRKYVDNRPTRKGYGL